jgi:hypothetical protein
MKTIRNILIIAPFLFAVVHAGIPQKAPPVKYTGLWTNSPFTSKPPPPPPGEVKNPLDDFTLTGIAPVPGGYMITIMSKKDPTKKMVITPGGDSEFKVVSVNRNPGERLGTTVVLSAGSVQGTVSFEPELITIKAPPAAAQQANNPTLPPGVTPAQAAGAQTPQRPPRPRIVPPPTSGNPKTPTQSTRGNAVDRRTERRR